MAELDKSALYRAKVRALVGATWGTDGLEDSTYPFGGAVRRGTTGFVLADERGDRSLGAALAWAKRDGVDELHVLATDDVAPDLARRAQAFSLPITVWTVVGRELSPTEAGTPAMVRAIEALDPDVRLFVDVIEAAGADPIVDGGLLLAEFLGLEVGRVVGSGADARFEVGVGKHDRWAQREVHGEGEVLPRLRDAVEVVRRTRVPDGSHPFASLAPERWLRRVLLARPELVGAAELRAIPTPISRDNLRDRAPAAAVGRRVPGGEPVVVVSSVGIDPDLVPVAADARAIHEPSAALLLVVPEGDDHWLTRDLAAALRDPAEVRTIGSDWRTLYP